MPVEILDEAVTAVGGDFGNVTSKPGQISVWAINDGPPADGFPSRQQLETRGLPFEYGDRRSVRGFQVGKIKHASNGKEAPNIVKGASGREYVEMVIDEKSMLERTKFQAQIATDRQKSFDGGDGDEHMQVVSKLSEVQEKAADRRMLELVNQ